MRQIISSEDIERLFTPSRRDAQELLPHLIRRLIMMSASDAELRYLNMAAGDDIRAHGWDGTVQYAGKSTFIPEGTSVWEMGVSEDPQAKAAEDYSKRTAEPGSIDRRASTFVFVTSRVWVNRQAWIDKCKSGRAWQDVRVIDASVIATWLERAPVIAAWVADQLGRPIDGLETIEFAWRRRVSSLYGEAVTPQLVIGGRDDAVKRLVDWLSDPTGNLELQGETLEEALGFAMAVCREQAQSSRSSIADRALVITRPSAAAHLATLSRPHIGVLAEPGLAGEYGAHALPNVHLIIPRQEDSRSRAVAQSITLEPMKRKAIEKSLIALGRSEERAYDLARLTKGSLQALLWTIAQPERGVLGWATGKASQELAPLVLAGRWTLADHADHMIVATLADRPYADIRQTIAEWSGPGKPLQLRGGTCDWKAWDFAWARLVPAQTADSLSRLYSAARTVLLENDPALALPVDRRWMAGVLDKSRSYSPHLRQGLVRSLVQVAIHTAKLPGNGQAQVDAIVREVLTTDSTMSRWLSLRSELPDLAEAAPDAFLDAVEALLRHPTAAQSIFQDTGEFVFSGCPHASLLWALERLAWSADHLGRVVQVLAGLAHLDPGGRWSNRPSQSLRALFLPWHPGTWAPLADRIAAMRVLFGANQPVAWTCGLSLLPRGHDIGGQFEHPRWRSWGEDRVQELSFDDYWLLQEALVDLLLKHAQTAVHLKQLVPFIPELLRAHPTLGERALGTLLAFDTSKVTDAELRGVYDAIDEVLDRHENHAAAEGALDPERLSGLTRARDRFQPRSARLRHASLFERWRPRRTRPENSWQEEDRQLEHERREAVMEVLNEEGIPGIIGWAADVARPEVIGYSLARVALSEAQQIQLLDAAFQTQVADQRNSPVVKLALGYSSDRFHSDASGWWSWAVRSIKSLSEPQVLALFAESAAPGQALWGLLDCHNRAAAESYWSQVWIRVLDDLESFAEAVDRLIQANRLFAAIDVCGMLIHCATTQPTKEKYDPAGVCEVLEHVLDAPITHSPQDERPPCGNATLSSEIDAALSYLELHGAAQSRLAQLELKWLPLLQGTPRGAKSLSLELARDPSLFVQVLVQVYRASSENNSPPAQLDEKALLAAQYGAIALQAWDRVPGLDEAARRTNTDSSERGLGPIHPAWIGTVDQQRLETWMRTARELAAKQDRADVADSRIGQVLAHCPADPDGLWPCASVRAAIELVASPSLERGFLVGVINRRGVHVTGHNGSQEAQMAKQFRAWCEKVRIAEPRTGKVLRELAEHYEHEGRRDIERGKLEEFDR